MKSRTSLFSKTIFIKNLTRLWPVWALFSLGGLITAFASHTSTFMRQGDFYAITYLDARSVYYNMIPVGIPIASFIMSVVVFANVFNYMYTTRGTVFFHSLPVTRNALFFTNAVSSYVMVVIPQFVGWFVFTILTITKGVFDPKGAFTCLYAILAISLLMSGMSLISAQLTGRTSSMVLLNISSHFFFSVTGAVIATFYSGFLYGIRGETFPAFNYLSPIVGLMGNIKVSERSDYAPTIVNGETVDIYRILDVTIENLSLVGVYLIVAIVLILVSYFLYKARSSESATEVVAFKGVRPILLYSYAVVAAIAGAIILNSMLDYAYNSTYSPVRMVFFIIFTSLIAYYVGKMIIERSIRVFTKKTMPGAIIITVLMVALTIVLASDPTHKVTSVPDVEDVDSIIIATSSGEFFLEEGDEELMQYVISTQKKIAELGDHYESFGENNWYFSISFYYNLKNGKTETRSYDMSLYKQYLTDHDSLESLLDEFVNTEPVVEKIYHLNGNKLKNDYLSVGISTGSEEGYYYGDNLEKGDVEKFRSALLKDIREKKAPRIDIFSMGDYNEEALATCDFMDYIEGDGDSEYVYTGGKMLLNAAVNSYRQHYFWGRVDVVPEMTNTVNLLKELGYKLPEK